MTYAVSSVTSTLKPDIELTEGIPFKSTAGIEPPLDWGSTLNGGDGFEEMGPLSTIWPDRPCPFMPQFPTSRRTAATDALCQ